MTNLENIIQNSWPFAYLNETQKNRLREETILQAYQAGEKILSLQDMVSHAYFIVEGSASCGLEGEGVCGTEI